MECPIKEIYGEEYCKTCQELTEEASGGAISCAWQETGE